MKKIIIFQLVFFMAVSLKAQKIKDVFSDTTMNYYQKIEFVNNNTEQFNKLTKKEQKRYARQKWFWEGRIDKHGSAKTYVKQIQKAYKHINKTKTKKRGGLVWEQLGPNSVVGGSSNARGIGRVESIWCNPDNIDHIIAGGCTAGLWETQNGGANWYCISKDIPGGVMDFVVHPTDSRIIYIIASVSANGPLKLSVGYSYGIYKGTRVASGEYDWNELNTDISSFLEFIEMDKNNPDIIYATTRDAVYQTKDGGVVWDEIFTAPSGTLIRYLETSVDNSKESGTAYTTTYEYDTQQCKIYKKNPYDDFEWTELTNDTVFFPASETRYYMQIKTDIDNPDRLYAMYDVTVTGRETPNPNNERFSYYNIVTDEWFTICTSSSDITLNHNKLFMEITPNGNIFAGGLELNLYNEADDFIKLTSWIGPPDPNPFMHADVRDMSTFDNNGKDVLFVAHDGGVSRAENFDTSPITLSNISGDLALNQFYNVAISEDEPQILVAGSHDCGTVKRKKDGSWSIISGGDGGQSLIDYSNSKKYFYTVNYELYHSSSYRNAILELGGYGSPYYQHPTMPSIIYARGVGGLHKSTDGGATFSLFNGLRWSRCCYKHKSTKYTPGCGIYSNI